MKWNKIMYEKRINEIKALLNTIPKGKWHYSPGDEFDHWEIWSDDKNSGFIMVQDDAGVPPDQNFINFVLTSREIIEELIEKIEKYNQSEHIKQENG